MSVFNPEIYRRNTTLACSLLNRGKILSPKNVTRLTLQDVPRMMSLKNKITEMLFGNPDIYDYVYNSYLTLGIEDDGKLVGAVCFYDYPNIKALPTWSWESWIKNIFDLDILTTLNSKWVHLLLFDIRYTTSFLAPILQVLFSEHKKLKYVAFAIPPGIKIVTFLTEFVTRISPRGCISPQTTTTIGLIARKDFFKKYKIRKAVEEDNDDIVSMIDQSSTRLKRLYGEYYISELLSRVEGTSRHIIVAEYNNYAVAVMIINEDVNYEILNESFEVGPFHGFRTVHEKDEYFYPPDTSRQASLTNEESMFELISYEKLTLVPLSPTLSENTEEEVTIEQLYSSSSSSSEESWTIDPSLDLSTVIMHKEEDDFFDLTEFLKMGSQSSLLSTCLLNTDDNIRTSLIQIRGSRGSSTTELKPITQEILKKIIHIPTFYGRPNAFALEVLVSEPDHEQAVVLLLKSAFECFKNKSYCLMCSPSMEPPVDFLKDFVRVTPRNHGSFPHDLFILHRNTIDCDINVRLTTEEDIPYIIEFLNQMMKPSGVFKQFAESLHDPDSEYITLIMTCQKQIIGIAVVKEHVDIEYLYAHYSFYKWIDETKHGTDSVAALENFLIYPAFHRFSRYFLSQIHRLADFSMLVYSVTYNDLDYLLRDRPLLNCIQYLVPIAPRHLPDYDPKFIEESCFPPKYVTETVEVFCPFISMTRLIGLKRTQINTRIVVVGTGDTAMSFLETLVCGSCPDLLVTFNNITVVSPHGLPFWREVSKAKNTFAVNRGYTVYHRILQINLRIHVNIVHGVLNKIQRKSKTIIINELTQLPYDYLVLFCGEQYRLPTLRFRARKKFSDFPENAFMINTDNDAIQVFNKMMKYKRDFSDMRNTAEDYVIVYGKDIRAIACLGSLLEHGVPARALAFVEPFNVQNFSTENPEYSNLVFPDPEIAEAIDKHIINLGVKLFKGYVLADWEISEDNKVTTVDIVLNSSNIQLGCKFIFIYAEKSISLKTYQAIFRAGLVFDGRLVIDSRFCTNDPYIFAAGPLTKYSRRYHAEHMSHIYFNASEVGETIGRQFRDMLIPDSFKKYERKVTHKGLQKIIEKLESPLPEFERPIVVYCSLPGEVFYLSVTSPGKPVPVELLMTSDDYGQLIVTGEYEHLERQGYFRLHINPMDTVESICCLSKQPMDVTNLVSIWGKHIALLNDLLVRFEMGMVNDLFEFFKEPFLCAMVYDKFHSLMEEIRELFLDTEVKEDQTIADVILELYEKNRWNSLTERQNLEVKLLVRGSTLFSEVEDKVLEYIQKNRLHLPMYAYPSLVQRILQSHKKSPMFTK